MNYIWNEFNGNTPPNIRNIETIYASKFTHSLEIKTSITDMKGTVISVEYMEINTYGSNKAYDDWIITPSFNPNKFKKEVLSLETWTHYTDTYSLLLLSNTQQI